MLVKSSSTVPPQYSKITPKDEKNLPWGSLHLKKKSGTPTSLLLVLVDCSQFWDWRSGGALKRVSLFNKTKTTLTSCVKLLQNWLQSVVFGTRSGLREKTRVTSSVENKWEWNSLINEACFQILMHNACCLCHSGFKWIKPARNRFNFDVISWIFQLTLNIFVSSRFILKIWQICCRHK